MSNGSDDRRHYFNGVNAVTGAYAIPPMTDAELVARVARARPPPAGHAVADDHVVFRPPFGTEEDDVTRAGWGIVFADDTPADVRSALQPLVDQRAKTVLPNRLKALTYTTDEDVRAWLSRNGVSTSNVDPTRVPYYLLLVGPPTSIPFAFQILLGVQYVVGRVAFPTAAEYAQYARSVVAYETDAQLSGAKEVAFWGTSQDAVTTLSSTNLLAPLAEGLPGGDGPIADEVGFRRRSFVAAGATKANLTALLRSGPAVLFTASHGVELSSGHEFQEPLQGALVCQDWPGPAVAEALDPAFYFAAGDVPDDARVHGLVAICFACFGAGTPAVDVLGRDVADAPFVARLPQRLLAHPAGGALAVIGHVDSALGSSFQPPGAAALGPQIQPFRDTLGHVMAGRTVGFAARGFSERAAALAAELAVDFDPVGGCAQPAASDDSDAAGRQRLALAARWAERNDAQNFVILGDPAVRLRVDRLG